MHISLDSLFHLRFLDFSNRRKVWKIPGSFRGFGTASPSNMIMCGGYCRIVAADVVVRLKIGHYSSTICPR